MMIDRQATWVGKLSARRNSIHGTGGFLGRGSGKRRYDARGRDFSNQIISSVRHVDSSLICRDALWIGEPRSSSETICTSRVLGQTRERGHDSGGGHLLNRMRPIVNDVEVSRGSINRERRDVDPLRSARTDENRVFSRWVECRKHLQSIFTNEYRPVCPNRNPCRLVCRKTADLIPGGVELYDLSVEIGNPHFSRRTRCDPGAKIGPRYRADDPCFVHLSNDAISRVGNPKSALAVNGHTRRPIESSRTPSSVGSSAHSSEPHHRGHLAGRQDPPNGVIHRVRHI